MADKRIINLGETESTTNGYLIIDKGGAEAEKISPANLLYFDFNKVADVVVADNNYQEINRLVTPSLEAGKYMVGISMTYAYDVANRSAFFRFSTDGGTTWFEFLQEPSDSTNKTPLTYFYPIDFAGGVITFVAESKKEQAGDVLTIDFCDLIIERKG